MSPRVRIALAVVLVAGAAWLLDTCAGPPAKPRPPATSTTSYVAAGAPTPTPASTAPPGTGPEPRPTVAPTSSPAGPTTTSIAVARELSEPVTEHLPHYADTWSIDFVHEPALSLVIRLTAVLNRPDQRPAYLDALRTAKAEALAWLRSAAPPGPLPPVRWIPAEAASL